MNKPIPEGYQSLMPYLLLPEAEGFFSWMQAVFGATEKMREQRPDGSLAHCELQVDGQTIMYSSAADQWPAQTGGFFIYVDDADATQTKALAEGGTEVMPVTNQEYGRSGGVRDPFGNTWWITTQAL